MDSTLADTQLEDPSPDVSRRAAHVQRLHNQVLRAAAGDLSPTQTWQWEGDPSSSHPSPLQQPAAETMVAPTNAPPSASSLLMSLWPEDYAAAPDAEPVLFVAEMASPLQQPLLATPASEAHAHLPHAMQVLVAGLCAEDLDSSGPSPSNETRSQTFPAVSTACSLAAGFPQQEHGISIKQAQTFFAPAGKNVYTGQHISAALQKYWSLPSEAALRGAQRQVLQAVLDDQDLWVQMPTGAGKSLCYQLPAILEKGVSVVISPLVSLMRDQVNKLQERGIAASSLIGRVAKGEQEGALVELESGRLSLFYVSPERLVTHIEQGGLLYQSLVHLAAAGLLRRFVVDEAHCVCEWGHGFRPLYRRLSKIRECFPGVPIMACTATASVQMALDVRLGLMEKVLC